MYSSERPNLEVQMKKCRILSEQWEETVGQIQKIEGFTDFLQAVPFSTLRTAAAEGPVILINISNYRSDAIILHIDNPPILVCLPDVRPDNLTLLSKQLASTQDQAAVSDPSKLILSILRDLWKDIVSPVVDCLDRLAVPHKSRIWWCPTSELCGLPLHAAGLYQPRQKNLPDIYTSSYTQTLSALIRARSSLIDQSVVPSLLVVGQSETLPSVQVEINNIQRFGEFVHVLVSADANRETVLRGLEQHSWAHFACHGHLGDNNQPFHGSFELHDGSHLTLLDLIQARLPNAELAFLSACHAAAGDSNTPNETIHLTAALQFCGFRSVVGTLWAMADIDGPVLAKEFYTYMFRKPGNKVDFRDSAEGLNRAIRALRKNRVPLERWIMFVHFGA
jgi:CHAT domain-containing protein